LGARAEHADNRLELPGDEEVYGRGYYDFFPSANLTYNFDRGRRIRFSYSMRVRRPASRVLNPINTSSDPLHIRIGNPDIEPQYTHSYTINANWSGDLGYIRATPFLRRSVNQWEQLRTVDENGIATTTYDNLGSTNSYGVSLTGSLRDFHGFRPRVSINGQHTRRNFSARIDRVTPPSTRWSVRGNLDREHHVLRLQNSLVYNPARDLPQVRQSSTTMTRVGARYRFLDRRASLNIDVTDPFDIYDSSIQRSASSYVEIGNERVSMRRVTMSLSYSFQGGATARGGGGPRGRGFSVWDGSRRWASVAKRCFQRTEATVKNSSSNRIRLPGRQIVQLVVVASVVGCDIPTEMPDWDTRWVLPAEATRLPLEEILPEEISRNAAGDGFLVTLPEFSAASSLREICPECAPLDGITIPKPPFTLSLTDELQISEWIVSGEVDGGSVEVRLQHDFDFDPLRPGGAGVGYLVLRLRSGTQVLARDSISGATTALPPGRE